MKRKNEMEVSFQQANNIAFIALILNIVISGAAGYLACKVMEIEANPVKAIALGVVGGFLGGVIMSLIGVNIGGFLGLFLTSVLGAVVFIYIFTEVIGDKD